MVSADQFFLFLWGILSVVFDFSKGVWEISHRIVMNVVGFRYTKVSNRDGIGGNVFVGRRGQPYCIFNP